MRILPRQNPNYLYIKEVQEPAAIVLPKIMVIETRGIKQVTAMQEVLMANLIPMVIHPEGEVE